MTDYLAAPLRFTNGEIHVASFTTRAAGWIYRTPDRRDRGDRPPLRGSPRSARCVRTAINLLDAYVGHDAGERIMAGRIRLGDTETIRAAIWLSDMRGFTELADRVRRAALIELLNGSSTASCRRSRPRAARS